MMKVQRLVVQTVCVEAEDSHEAVLRTVIHAYIKDCGVDLTPFIDRICATVLRSEPISTLDGLTEMGFRIKTQKDGTITLTLHGPRGAAISGLNMRFIRPHWRCAFHKLSCKAFYRRGANSGWNVRLLVEEWGGADPLNLGIGHHEQVLHPHTPRLSTERTLTISASVEDVADKYQ